MPNRYREIAFTDAVRGVQADQGSLEMNAAQLSRGPDNAHLSADETAFLEAVDSFYVASVSATGWPYLQHRGGAAGFVKVLAPDRIGWAEYSGNRQYITTGNLAGDGRVSLFFMDYARKARLKVFGHAETVARDAPEAAALRDADSRARVERGMLVRIAGFDWNCPSHVPDRFTLPEVETATRRMLARIAELEAQIVAASP